MTMNNNTTAQTDITASTTAVSWQTTPRMNLLQSTLPPVPFGKNTIRNKAHESGDRQMLTMHGWYGLGTVGYVVRKVTGL